MKRLLRLSGLGMITAGVIIAIIALLIKAPAPKGEVSWTLYTKEKVISGVYKSYGVKTSPFPFWLAKTVIQNNTSGRLTNLRLRYRVLEYSEWSSWRNYIAVDPSQTIVDLYYPILSSGCARLTSRAPSELLMECEYLDANGNKRQITESRPLTFLGKNEFIFSDLTEEERTEAFQDKVNYAPLLAAFVSRGDDVVNRLASIANKKAGGVGATQSDDDCVKVMEALYNIMKTIHISYQHPEAMLDPGLSFDLKTVQSIQYPRETIQKRSGTCIDLAILYAAMMNSVGIPSYLVVKDGHCFPMGRLPSGKPLPVETTGVQDGYGKALSFFDVVKIGLKTMNTLRQNGRFFLVDLSQCWMSGISNPELEPLPPDTLERWGIMKLVEPRAESRAVPAPAPPRSEVAERQEQWGGRIPTAQVELLVKSDGQNLIMMYTEFVTQREINGGKLPSVVRLFFQGKQQGLVRAARCNEGTMKRNGRDEPYPKHLLPAQFASSVSSDGRSQKGTITLANGNKIHLSLKRLK